MNLSHAIKTRFIEETIPSDLLENMVQWIGDNLAPDDVFPDTVLEEWAEDAGYVVAEAD